MRKGTVNEQDGYNRSHYGFMAEVHPEIFNRVTYMDKMTSEI